MKETELEKAAKKISDLILQSVGPRISGMITKSIDIIGMTAFSVLSQQLREQRKMIESDFKTFCKKNKLTQYQIDYIEKGEIHNINLDFFKKYITLISAEEIVKSWIQKFPHIAEKHKIKV